MDIQKQLVEEFEQETKKTRKMLEAIPEGADFTWAPHAKSMPLGKLADHVAGIPGAWAASTLTKDKVEWDPASMPPTPADKAALLAAFETEIARSKTALATMTPEKWDSHWQFGANGQIWLEGAKYFIWRNAVVNHMVHHRAQLGVYLRLLGQKIPGSYGPSADEM